MEFGTGGAKPIGFYVSWPEKCGVAWLSRLQIELHLQRKDWAWSMEARTWQYVAFGPVVIDWWKTPEGYVRG